MHTNTPQVVIGIVEPRTPRLTARSLSYRTGFLLSATNTQYEDKNNTTHQRVSDQSGRRRSGVCPVGEQMNPEGGEEKTIKGHACHELTTTALAIAP